jgi:DNA-binding GntR family transcriptional regulator
LAIEKTLGWSNDEKILAGTAMTLRDAIGTTLTDRAYRQIREDILSGALPPGRRLRLAPLKTQYGIGASPIREALARLCGDGLVTLEERRGFAVAGISLEELWDVSETRILIETAALAESIRNAGTGSAGDAWEAQILAAYHRLSKLDKKLGSEPPSPEWERLHGEFHESLVAACRLKKLKFCRQMLFEQSERYRRLSLADYKVPRDVSGEHAAIMQATLDRDAETACSLLADHIRKTAEIVAEAVSKGNGSWRQDPLSRELI